MSHVVDALRIFLRTDGQTIPMPGTGSTRRRFDVLARWSATDLSVGRLVEGHCDALAILAEAETVPAKAGVSYGVWAARSSVGATWAEPEGDGWRLTGTKPFCSGTGIIERALVTADSPDGYRLFDISPAEQIVSVLDHSWPAVGMADSRSETVEFAGPIITADRAVGPPGFYTGRPGFWFGASGVAACWYGGARALVAALLEGLATEPSEHVLADLGVAFARVRAMRDVLDAVADDIDRDPSDATHHAQIGALVARQTIHDLSLEVLTRVGAAGGARNLCLNGAQSRRVADLFAYLSQHHGGADASQLGELARKLGSCH